MRAVNLSSSGNRQALPGICNFPEADFWPGSDTYRPHWTGWDPKTQRLVVTSSMWSAEYTERLYLLKLDPATGALTLDDAFRDTDGKIGFSFANRQWPHGWNGSGLPHGAVFSR